MQALLTETHRSVLEARLEGLGIEQDKDERFAADLRSALAYRVEGTEAAQREFAAPLRYALDDLDRAIPLRAAEIQSLELQLAATT